MAVALNETGYVAVVGDVQYKTLAEALEAVQAGGTVTLLDDVALDATLEIGKNVTLELAGFTVTGNVIVQGDADVTFRGGVMTAVSGNSVIDVKGSAVLNLDGMTVDGGNALNVRSSIHAVVYESVGGLHITGSEILGGTLTHDENCGSTGSNSAARAVYAYGNSGGSISIENSTLKGGNGKTDATYAGDFVAQWYVDGGIALELGGNAAVEVKNSTIHGGDSDWRNAEEAINVSNSFKGTLNISGNSKISGGNALNGTGKNWGYGGQGIYTHQTTGCTQIDIRDSEITGGDGGGSWDGSGIELNKNVSTNIENSTIASGQGAVGGDAGSISINSRVSEVDVTLKDVTLNGDGDGNDVIKGATDGIKIAGEITIAGGTLEDVTFSEIETGTVIKTAGTGAVDVSSVTGTTSVPVFNEATGEYEFEPAAVSVNGKAYRTLAEAVAAAQDGDTVTVLGNISGETVTVDKNLTIVGTRTGEEYVGVLNDVIMNAGAGVTLSVKDLKFGGNSYVNADRAAALNVEGCYADVTPSKITGRSAFIVTGTSEVSTGLLLTVKNNTIIASKGGNQAGDAYAAAIFGWSYLADGSEISGNTFGSETVPYNFIAVKTMNAMAGAVIKVGNNTIYGSNASFDFYAFDFFQNNSRANVYTVLLDGNAVTNANAGTSENSFVFACVEANTGSFGPGHAQVLITGSNTQDGNVVALDQLDLTEGQYSYAGTGVTFDADGKITAGDFAGDLAAVLPALAADLFVTSDGVVQPIAAADVSTLYVNGEWAVTPDTVKGTILDDGKYYDINAYSSASDAFDSFTAENRNIELIGDQLLKTDFDDGGEWPKRNFDLALDGDLTLKAADGAESTLTLTVVDSQNSGGGSTNEVGELAFYSSSADQRATFTLEKGVTIDTNAKIWFGRPTQSSSSDTTPTDIVVNGNIIQQAHDGRYYGILQIQTEKDSTVLVNGSVAFGWTLSVRGAVFTVSSTGEVKASDPASTSSTILVDARSGVGGKFIVDGSKAVSAVVLDVDELGSFEMKNEAAAAFDTVDLAKNATLLVADGSTLTADAVTNAGTIQITGENGKLAVAEGGLTNKGAIVFGASDKTVNTTFDVGMLSKKAGSSAFNFQNGEVTLTGVMADGIRIQPFNVGRNSENVALDAASAIVNIAAGAVVNTHQTYIAENDGVNEHTLNVYGTLNAMTSIFHKMQGNLNIYGTVTANYMQGAGNVLVSGENAVLNLAGNGGNSLLMGRTGRTFRIADGGTVIAGGNVSVGYDEYSGVMEITGGGRLEAQTITVNNSSRLTLDHTASLSFGSITKAANATITVDLSGYTDQFALLIENTGSDATDYASLISNWNELEAAGCTVVGNDLFLGEVDMTVFKVDAGWNGSEFTEEVAPGYRYGINAFDNISAAVAASDSSEIMVVGGTFDGNQFFDGHSAVIAGTAENEVVVNGYIFGGAYNGNTGDASVKITGGSVRRVYGAGSYDQAGTYTAGDIAVEIAEGVTIGERVGAAKVDAGNLTTGDVTITSAGDMTNLFGGAQVWYKGSSATHKSVTVNLTGEMSDVVYAAGQAMHGGWITVENGVTVNVDGGSIGSDGLMGGGFTRSDISETDTAGGITISGGTWINFSAGDISAIYGGTHTYSLSGQLEAVSNITGGTHIAMTGGTAGNVQGGGYTAWGSKSVIDSTEVNISGGTVLYDVQGGSYVVGGGKDAASGNSSTITGDATVRISGDAVIQGNVIGGGWVNWATGTAASTIGGVSTVSVEGGTIHGDVIGGGVAVTYAYDAASSVLKSESAQTVVTLTGGTVKGNVYGGGYAEDAYGKGSAVSSDASGSSVTVAGATVEGDIYAGGFASGENTTSTVTGNVAVTISSGTIKGDVYGGSKGGTVNGDSVITISGGTFDPAKGIYGSDSVKGSSLLNFTNTEALEVGTVSGFASVTLGAGDVKFNAIESEEVNFGGSLSFEEVTEGGITVQKNGTEVMLAAGRKNISSVKSEDVEIGSMGRNGQLTGVEQLVLQKGNELAVTDLTIYGGSSLTITLGSTFSFAGTVDLVDSGFVLNGGNSYLYGAAAVTVDLSGREEGKAYKLVAYTGAGDADFSFVTVDADTVEFNNSLYLADADRSTFYVRLDYTEENALEEGLIFGYNAFNGLNQALGEAAAGPDKIMIAAGTYDEGAAQFVKGVEVVSENAVFANVWNFGVNSDTGRDFDMETAEKFTVTGDLTVGQFYAEKNANVYVKIDGNLTTVGSFGAKLATQVDVNGTVTVTPPQNGAAQVMVYGTMNVTGTLDVTTGAMGAVLRVGDGRYETEYGKGGVLNVSGADASVVLRNNTGSAIPVTVSAMSSLNISGGATFANETGGMQNLGTVNVDNATLTLGGTLENSGTVTVSGTSVLNISALTGEIVLADGAMLTDSSVGGTVSAEGNVSVAGTTSVDRLVLKGVRGENSELSIGADAVVAVKQLEVGTGLQKPDLVPGDTAAREYFSKAQIDGALTVDRANQAGAIYIRPYAELVVTGTLNVKGEVHNRGSLVVDGGTMNISDWETPKLLGYTTGDSLTVTNQGSMILTGVSTVTFGEAHAYKAEMGVEAQYADGMFATILAGGKFEADTLAFRNDDDVTLTVTGEGSSFKLYSASGRTATGTYNYAVNEGAIIVAEKASFDVSGLANAEFVNSGSITLSSASAKFATLTNNGTFTVSGVSTLNIGKLTGNTLQVVADTTLTDSVIGGNVSVGFNAENAADTTLTLAGDTSIGTLYVGKENRTNDYKFVIAGEETTVKLGSLYSRTGSTTTISNGATLDISDYWQSKGMVTVDASTINHSGYNFYVYNNDSTDTAAIALMNGAVLNHINAYSLTLGSTTETVSGVAKGNASVTLEGGSTLNVNRLYLNATGTVEEVAGAEAKTSLTAVDSTVTARGEVGIGAGATVSLGNSAFTANTLISSGAIVMDSLSTITCAGAFTSTGTITARVDAAQSGVSFVQKLINASTLTVNDSLTVEGGREGAQLVATGNALWLDNSDKSTILINSEYAGEVGSAIAGRDGYFFGFNALTEYSTSIGADSAVEFTGGSYSFADGFSFTGREFTVSGDTSFDKVTGGAVAVTGGTLSIDTVVLTADIAALSGALLAFSGSGMADLANLVLTVSGTMANRTKYVLATGVKDDSFAVTLNGETYELNVRKDGLLVGVENGELYVQKSNDWFMLSRDTVQTVLPEDGYAFGGSDMHESAVMSVERDLNVATNGQNAGARVYGGGLLRNDALFSGTQKCEVTVTAGGVGKGVIGGNRVESGSIGGTLTSSVTIDSADGTFGFIVGGNQLTGGELNGFGGTSVTIQNGTFSMWICGGSVAGGDAAAQVMGNTNVTITGGTFNGTGVFGGGFVQENGTLNQVGNTNVTISGGTFAGNIYGGHGATNKDASPNGVLFGNTNITISGGIFNGNIYGGGFDQSKVQGDTHITFTGTAGADFSVNGIIDGDASNARYWSKGSFVTGDRYLTFDAFTGEFGATLITNIDQMEVTGGSDVNLKNQLDLSEVSQWEFDFGSSLEGFAQNDLAGDTLVLSGWEDQLGDEGWTVMSGSSITGFGEMEVTNGSNLIFAWNADEQYYLGSIGDEQFKLSMEDGAMKLAKLA
ncbi:beta strand repeat-containing protein [Victivallis vadensis]|uniref:beta strand repeat-containing protein n=1 Tax=Victivallis vadensis TaxID=172901 RepID=UPI003AF8973B